jgi:glycosyltransferase involved in cell wall biosynthesis
MTQPWLTVVTAVRDDPDGLERTLASLHKNDLSGVEVVVIDSSKHRDSVVRLSAGIAHVHWVPPAGIYAAMNDGLRLASGDFVQFLNAGDVLHDSGVLSSVRIQLSASPAWAFGTVEIVSRAGKRVTTPSWDYASHERSLFSKGFFPQHQGMFTRTESLRSIGGFDTSFTIAADYAAFLRLSQVAEPLILDRVVADFFEGGASTIHWKHALAEFHRARREIFQPRGHVALVEQWRTSVQFARAWAYRAVLEPLRARR